jgi:hemolysin activation/secretion protein
MTLPVTIVALADENTLANSAQNAQSTTTPPANTLDIYEYRVQGNSVLTDEIIESAIYPFLGQDKAPEDVDNARAALEKTYQDLGYKTVQVLIPQQTVRDGVVILQVIERHVGQLDVKGAKYSSVERIKSQAPSFAVGKVPNFNEVTKDLVVLNQFPDRRISPALRAGTAPDTIDVDLAVDDELPVHGSLELNNRRSAGTSELRASANLSYTNLWQRGHSFNFSYQAAPENLNDSQVIYASYLAPIAGTRYSILFNAIRSDSNVSTIGGIDTLGIGNVFGIRGIAALRSTDTFNDSVSFGLDRKSFKQNLQFGSAGSTLSSPITYYPFSLTYTGVWREPKCSTQADLGLVFASRQLGDDAQHFDTSRAYAKGQQLALRFGITNIYDFSHGIQLTSRLKGQVTDQPLLSYEQFSAGGADTVRGYYEAEAVGDYGVTYGIDLKSPTLFKSWIKNSWVNDLNLYGFVGGASVHSKNTLPGSPNAATISSTGLGLSFRAFRYVDGNVEWALPLQNGPTTSAGESRILFQMKSSF